MIPTMPDLTPSPVPSFVVIIPARYASTRLPGKVLLPLAGKPIVQRVYEQALASGAQAVVIATDDARISQACEAFGAQVVMTADTHSCGTERLEEACRVLDLDPESIVVNVQGDEPLMPPQLIRQAATLLAARPESQMATLCHPLDEIHDVFNPNVVKVVFNRAGQAMYFSRAPIPWQRQGFDLDKNTARAGLHYRHIGIYAYRAGFLSQYVAMEPGPEEQAESLEQLRALHHGVEILVSIACETPGPGIDTEGDLEKARRLLEGRDLQ
jgi:3-deoxy-manno-octulosonate cytidylyltransferase (CMP-KDO synthetase)